MVDSKCNKGRGMCYPVCGMMHIKEHLQLIGKCNPCSGGSGFHLSLYEWFYIISSKRCLLCIVSRTAQYIPRSRLHQL